MMKTSPLTDRFLICGLGSLGQYCIFNLKTFNLPGLELQLVGIDLNLPQHWEVPNLLDLLTEPPILGDCCREEILLKARVQDCRAILLVTDSESVNIQAAIAARRLNPQIRLVVRSSRPRLNDLLEQQLGNYVALEPTEFAASAFALEGLGSGVRGTFEIDGQRLQVVEQEIQLGDRRFDQIPPVAARRQHYRLLNGELRSSRILDGAMPSNPGGTPSQTFHQLPPQIPLRPGDQVTFIEQLQQDIQPQRSLGWLKSWNWQAIQQWFQPGAEGGRARLRRWLRAQPARPVIALGVGIGLLLWGLGSVLLKWGLPSYDLTWQKAISTSMILLLGGYGDVFGGLENEAVPAWLQGISLLITFASFVFVFGGLGLLADSLISSRFRVLRRRPALPKQGHVILIGFGRVGHKVARWLRQFQQALVVMTDEPTQVDQGQDLPLLLGKPSELLRAVHLQEAKSVIVVTDDQLTNLELALTVREVTQRLQQPIGLVVRTYDQRFSNNLSSLLPDIKVLTAYALAAEAFAGAAFGEDILALFRLQGQTVLVTEYKIIPGDMLIGKQLAAISYGYGVVPISHQRAEALAKKAPASLMPSDDLVLQAGDRLILLSSSNGLRRIEYGQLTPAPRWKLVVEKPLNPEFIHSGGNTLARISGCDLAEAHHFMQQLPNQKELHLYPYQAARLERELSKQLGLQLTLLSP